MHPDYQTLLLTSQPDNSPLTYNGPPIGYGARVVQHAASPGNESQVYGSVLAPRPLYVEQCETARCAYCKSCAFASPPFCKPDFFMCWQPRCSAVKRDSCEEYVSPRSSPIRDVEKMLRKLENSVH